MASKPTKATKIIHQQAQAFQRDCRIDWDSAFPTVTIDGPDGQDVFMQGDEADEFIAQIEALCKRFRSLDKYTAACALALPYAETLFN